MQFSTSKHGALVAILLLMCGQLVGQETKTAESSVEFAADVAPILQDQCVGCHDATLQMAGLRLDSRQAMVESGVLEPGNADDSLIMQRLRDRDLGILMPPTGKLAQADVDTLDRWIAAGAVWPDGVTLAAAKSESKDDARAKALFSVIRDDDLDAVRELLQDRALATKRDRNGATPLMHAAMYASPACVKLLIEKDAEVNATDGQGMTPLMFAVSDFSKVRLLLDAGAEVNTKSKMGRTALLMASAYAGNREVVSALLDTGADIRYADRRGWTSVVLAARTGDIDLVRALLDAGGDVNGGDAKRLSPGTPLMQAAWASDVGVAKLLLSHGADENQRSLDTALIFAATHGSLELAELLIDAGADPEAHVVTNYVPESPILAAAYSDSLNGGVVQLLLGRQVDVTTKDKRGLTPINIAQKRGPTEIVKMLIQAAGDDVKIETEELDSGRIGQEIEDQEILPLVEKSISLLQSCGAPFFAKSGCVACHQQTASSIVVSMALSRGVDVNEQIERQQVKLTSVDLQRKRVGFLQRIKVGGASHRIAYLLWGLGLAGYAPDEITDAAYIELAGLQRHDGSWVSDAHRPPTEYSPVTATAVSIRALRDFSPPGLDHVTEERIQRATQWLLRASAPVNAEKAFRLLGLRWGKADDGAIAEATRTLLEEQDECGGWSQLPAMPPDAYATGLTLYALHQGGGLSVTDDAYQDGIRFLVNTAADDGSWHVKSRSFAIQPSFESGFPYGHDQWISAAATGWAAAALIQTLAPVDQ